MNGQQLKNSILQLAIQGKLVPQDPNDEPASVLLGKIRKEKEQLVKAGKLKKKDLVSTPITDEDKPFEIPESWEWVRLSSLTRFIEDCPHSTAKDEGKGFPLIRTSNIGFNKFILKGVHRVSESVYNLRNARAIPTAGDLIYAREATAGNIAVIDEGEKFCLGQRTVLISPFKEYIDSSWLAYTILSPYSYNSLVGKSTGTTVAHVNLADLRPFIIPLPPLSEQHRIVAKIEELMPFVSEYDKAQSKLDELNDRLPSILKKSILQEAIMGKLVPQDPNDEPASALLSKIRKEKEQLVKAGKLKKKDLVSTPVADEEKPFEIPVGWEWCRIFDICNFANPDKRIGKYVCLDAKYLRGKSEGIILEKGNYVEANSHIILVDGENSGEVFTTPCCGYMGSTFKELIINSQPCEHYIRLFLLQLKEKLRNNKRGAAIPHLDKELFFQTLIPLPPLPEQHRIVEKIEELFGELNKAQI